MIKSCRVTYLKAAVQLIRLASLQCAFIMLDEEIKMASRRVNALEYVLIPRIEATIHYITQEDGNVVPKSSMKVSDWCLAASSAEAGLPLRLPPRTLLPVAAKP